MKRWIVNKKNKIFNLFNIQIQKNQLPLLISSSVSGLIYTYTHPVIVKEIYTNLPSRYISLEALWFCLSGLILGAIWKGCVRDKAIKYFTYIATIESIAAF